MAKRREDVGKVSAFPKIAVNSHRQSGIFMSVSLCPFISIEGFDPGSERTLAAWIRHASRAERPLRGHSSGERVSNAQITYPRVRDNPVKMELIPDTFRETSVSWSKDLLLGEVSVSY